MTQLAAGKGLLWSGSAWLPPPADPPKVCGAAVQKECFVTCTGKITTLLHRFHSEDVCLFVVQGSMASAALVLQEHVLDLQCENKLFSQHIRKLRRQADAIRQNGADVRAASEAAPRPLTVAAAEEELAALQQQVDSQREAYMTAKREHEANVATLLELQAHEEERLDDIRLQHTQIAAMTKFYFDTKMRLEAKCAALHGCMVEQKQSDSKFPSVDAIPAPGSVRPPSALQRSLQALQVKLDHMAKPSQ